MDISQIMACHIDAQGNLTWATERGGGYLPANHPRFEATCQALIEAGIEIDQDAPLISLVATKTAIKRQIDANAEAERLRYITPGEGQALTYSRKVEEAKRAMAENNPESANYPMLAASLGIDGDTLKAVAEVVLTMDAQWAIIGSQIEHTRLAAKQAVEAAEDEAAARAIVDAIVWPSAQMQP